MPKEMIEFAIAEISAVDLPAQKKAKALIAKADDTYARHTEPLHEEIGKLKMQLTNDIASALCRKDPRISKRRAEYMASGRMVAKAGDYREQFLMPSEPDHSREYYKNDTSGPDFMKRVREVKARDKCSHQKAMQTAQEEYPDEFKAYQRA